jgi:predicted AAA+ superfamily ATPase
MIKRHLFSIAFAEEFGRQMRFIAGPRQVGKTTLVRDFLKNLGLDHLYFNWDMRQTRDLFIKDTYFFESNLYDSRKEGKLPWAAMDEIHKMPKWKNILKDYFDKFENTARFIITGSARLDWFRKSGDALTGRYFLFRLFPLCLSEASGRSLPQVLPGESAGDFLERQLDRTGYEQATLEQLLEYSGFPEPFTKNSPRFFRRWQTDMVDQIIREDVRDLTRIIDLENIAVMIRHLPRRVGSPLSLNSIREDMDVSYTAVKNALRAMQLTYVVFMVAPYSRNIARSLKKEPKCYFFDWTRCEDAGGRFENYVAGELKAMTALWKDGGTADFDLVYVRTKDGKETDFLVLKDGEPWCLFEAKLKDGPPASHHYRHAEALGEIPFVQIVREPKVVKKSGLAVYRISASRFF